MAVSCPHCLTRVPLNKKRWNGQVFTYSGLPLRGQLDDDEGKVKASAAPLSAYYWVESIDYSIIDCAECHKEFVVKKYPERVVWPVPDPAVHEEIPAQVRAAFRDAKIAHSNAAEIAAAVAARVALERLQRDQCCGSLKGLVEQGKLSDFLFHQADEVRLWGNLVAHEDFLTSPSAEDIDQLLGYLELVLTTIYVHPAKLRTLQNKRKTKDEALASQTLVVRPMQ